MFVFVKLYGHHKLHAEAEQIKIPVSTVNNVSDVYLYLKKTYPGLTLSRKSLIVTVNDEISRMDQSIKVNDIIRFMPFMGGG